MVFGSMASTPSLVRTLVRKSSWSLIDVSWTCPLDRMDEDRHLAGSPLRYLLRVLPSLLQNMTMFYQSPQVRLLISSYSWYDNASLWSSTKRVRQKRAVDISQLNGDSPLEILGIQRLTSQGQNGGEKTIVVPSLLSKSFGSYRFIHSPCVSMGWV